MPIFLSGIVKIRGSSASRGSDQFSNEGEFGGNTYGETVVNDLLTNHTEEMLKMVISGEDVPNGHVSIMFCLEVPFDKLPLMVNSFSTVMRNIVKYRMVVGI